MKLATFNTNGIRPRASLILDWMNAQSPDVLCVQETKVQDQDFPGDAFGETGYTCAFKGQRSYNGVAIFSKSKLENVRMGFGDGDSVEEPRIIAAEIDGLHVVNTYCPQGHSLDSEKFQYKLDWFIRLRKYFERFYSPDTPLVWVGDFNIAPEDIDVHAPDEVRDHVCFHGDAKKALKSVREWGFVDVFRKHEHRPQQYSFWDYRIPNACKRKMGWRLDHIYATRSLADASTACWIDIEPRLKPKPSDHTFVVAEFDWK